MIRDSRRLKNALDS